MLDVKAGSQNTRRVRGGFAHVADGLCSLQPALNSDAYENQKAKLIATQHLLDGTNNNPDKADLGAAYAKLLEEGVLTLEEATEIATELSTGQAGHSSVGPATW